MAEAPPGVCVCGVSPLGHSPVGNRPRHSLQGRTRMSEGLAGYPLTEAGSRAGNPIPDSLAFRTAHATDDLLCALSDGTRLFILAEHKCGNDQPLKDTVQQWLAQVETLEPGDRLVLATAGPTGPVRDFGVALQSRRAGHHTTGRRRHGQQDGRRSGGRGSWPREGYRGDRDTRRGQSDLDQDPRSNPSAAQPADGEAPSSAAERLQHAPTPGEYGEFFGQDDGGHERDACYPTHVSRTTHTTHTMVRPLAAGISGRPRSRATRAALPPTRGWSRPPRPRSPAHRRRAGRTASSCPE